MKLLITNLFVLISVFLFAQNKPKIPLKIDDFAKWETITNPVISNDGRFVAYEIGPQKGDGRLILYSEKLEVEFERGTTHQFGPANDILAFRIEPKADEIRKAKIDQLSKDKMPKDSLGVYSITRKSILKYPNLKSFKIAEDDGNFVAFLVEPSEEKADTAAESKTDKKIKQPGNDLVILDVENEDTLLYKNVTEYVWAKNGEALYFIRELKDSVSTQSMVYAFRVIDFSEELLYHSEGFVKSIATDDLGERYSFLFSVDTTDQKEYSLYLGNGNQAPEKTVDASSRGIPVGWSPSEHGKVWFSENGTKLYFGTAEIPETEETDSIPEDEKPMVDVWSWTDLKLQPQQKVEVDKEKKRTYLAVYDITREQMTQLADLYIQNVSTIEKGNGSIGLGFNETPYLRESNWTGKENRDYYLIDFRSGIKREILKKQSYVKLSPNGKFFVWYNFADSSYYARSTDATDVNIVPLTRSIPVAFYDEWNDKPIDAEPYGIAGWDEDDRFIFIYDRYDIWKLDPTGEKVPVNMTKTFGRRNKTRLRYLQLDKDLDYIPTDQPIILTAFDERTMSTGFFETRLNTIKDPSLLVVDKYFYGTPQKAKNADKIIWTKEKVDVFPDVWISNLQFEDVQKISEANPWQEEYIWPTVELLEWKSFTGEELNGLLYKPDNFNPKRKYPMMIYFYERSAETMYRYIQPAPSRSTINKALYSSNDYLVFVPDILYETGYPGQSAYNAIVSGTQYLTTKYDYIDQKNIGLQGQSWGGYQTAYLITQTDLYAAAMAGAPVSNMTSAYGGIRWASGLSRMFQYERTQSRIGGTLWERPLQYIENSPLFYAPKVNTPLLIMHNDDDGAVPWYQGIELFVALRRLDKPVWMLTYNNEPHNLKAESWANRIDLSTRMFQFFNHYLKNDPQPEWMKKGIPAIEKGENLGYE